MFGRRKREEAAAAAAVHEAERRVLLEQLAQRPDTVCPFLGLDGNRAGYVEGADPGHRCYAFGDPAVLSDEQQTRVCLQRGYGNCPRYLRGVLVIPTEELEALRRPAPPRADAPPPPPPRRPRRFAWVGALVALLLIVGIGGSAWLFAFGGLDVLSGAQGSPTPSAMVTPEPSTPAPTPSPSAEVSVEPSLSPSPPPSVAVDTPTPLPTTTSQDVFAFYEVGVQPEAYVLYVIEDRAAVQEAAARFADYSHARVEPQQLTDGRVAWVTQNGFYAGYGYIAPDSGSFEIRAVFTSPDGTFHGDVLEPDELTVMPEGTPAP
ncbi:MAG: hypothetical protein ABI534_09470 [Chloroflexota bacterium]